MSTPDNTNRAALPVLDVLQALSGYAILARADRGFFTPSMAGTTLYVTLAMAGARHIFIVMYWQRVKAWLCRALNCEHCLKDCRFGPGGIERRKS